MSSDKYIKNRNLNDVNFFYWLKEWGKLKRTAKLKELKYEVKMETLLQQ